MIKDYAKEQFWKLYEKLPQELKDALFAEETGENIYNICNRNGILENMDQIVEYVGRVLVGLLTPEEFKEALGQELKLKGEVAHKVDHEINRFIFYPVKPALETLYKTGVAPIAGAEKPSISERKSAVSRRTDNYREPIE